jgi:uncharacterized protein (DUF486 family)
MSRTKSTESAYIRGVKGWGCMTLDYATRADVTKKLNTQSAQCKAIILFQEIIHSPSFIIFAHFHLKHAVQCLHESVLIRVLVSNRWGQWLPMHKASVSLFMYSDIIIII